MISTFIVASEMNFIQTEAWLCKDNALNLSNIGKVQHMCLLIASII